MIAISCGKKITIPGNTDNAELKESVAVLSKPPEATPLKAFSTPKT
ncbi:hypothetical protein [Anaerocolumna xylanovorans]|nr:hypothetical protein [Anaerocolumna xylanovorans]